MARLAAGMLAKAPIVAAVAAAASWSCPAIGACSVTATPIVFGIYNGVTKAEVQTVATVTVRCTDLIVNADYTLSVSPGQSGSATSRYLVNGANRLAYQVYADATRSQIFGDGSAGTVTRSGSVGAILGIGTTSSSIQLFPALNAGQSPPPGTYTDTLTVLVTY